MSTLGTKYNICVRMFFLTCIKLMKSLEYYLADCLRIRQRIGGVRSR